MISSQLQSQLFSKKATWDILAEMRLVWGNNHVPAEMRIEVWATCVYVHLPKNVVRKETPQGLSRFISFWSYLDWFMMRSVSKAQEISAREVRLNIWAVESFQDKSEIHTVHFIKSRITCTCMLYRCLGNRIQKEVPYLYKLMKKSSFFAGQSVCHHITAALGRTNFYCLEDYIQRQGIPA